MKIAWIGTGVMGAPMAGHLLAAGHELVVHTRTKYKADGLIARGARWADTPREAAAAAEVLCTMVGYPDDLDEVLLGRGDALQGMPVGGLLIDFTTSRPDFAELVATQAAERGVDALDAPVSGGDVGAREARLSIMVGGRREAFERARPVFECLGPTVQYHGPAGSGQHAKMVNQILIASSIVGVCEGLVYARRAGLNPWTVLDSVGGGAAASWTLTHLWPRMLRAELQPGFSVKHFVKDLQMALDEAARMKLDLPGVELARRLYEELCQMGGNSLGTQALILAVEDLNDPRR